MNNLDLSLHQNEPTGESLFDSIRHVDENGSEYWTARELMPLLFYKTWQKFNSVIEVAKENLETVVDNTFDHINSTVNVVKRPQGGGTTQLDYKLSRLACYHIALCCDSRSNNAVKAAKHYFAVKTREAEVAIPALSEQLQLALLENENLKLKVKLSDNDRYLIDKSEAIIQMHGAPMLALIQGRPDAVVEKVEKVTETIVLRDGRSVSFEGKSTAQVGKELGFRTGKEFERWLDKIGRGDLICQGLRVNQTPYIPTENLATIKRVWQENRGKTRQLLIGE